MRMNGNEMKEGDKQIVCFSGCDWWYHNRGLFCPQVMTRFAEKGYKVLFVNSLGMRVPSLRKDPYALMKIFRKLFSILRFLRKDKTGMYVLTVVPFPFLGTKLGRSINTSLVALQVKFAMFILAIRNPIAYIGCPPALHVMKQIKHQYMIYERTDIFEEMPGVDKSYICGLDNELMESSDLVLYVDRLLYERGLKVNPNSILIGHGVEYPFFANADQDSYVPGDIASIPKPIVGYFGDICDKTFDFELYEYLAKSLPDISFALIGPLNSSVDHYKGYDNIYILGQKPYEEIPHYGKSFDVSILPWKINRWVLHSYPVKIKEYIALGNPFVSIDIPASREYEDVIYLAKDYEGFRDQVIEALNDRDDESRLSRKLRVETETWDSKVETIISFINNGETNPA